MLLLRVKQLQIPLKCILKSYLAPYNFVKKRSLSSWSVVSRCVPKRESRRLLSAFSKVSVGVGSALLCLRHEAHCQKSEHPLVEPFDWHTLYQLALPDIVYILAAVLSALAVAILNVYIPAMLGDIVNTVSRFLGDPPQAMDFIREIKDPASRLLLLYIAQSLFTFVYISVLSYSGENMACRLRQQLFGSILKQDISFFDQHKTGEIISRLTADVQEFKSSFKLCVSQGIRSFTQSAGCVVSLYMISPKLTGVLLLVLPSIIFVGTALGSVLRKMSRIAQAQVGRAAAVADEAIGNIRTVRAFAMEDKELELYSKELLLASSLQAELGVGIGAFQGLANLALNGIVLGVLCLGGHLLTSREISPGSLMAFLVASQTIQRSLAQVSLLFGQYVRGTAAASRVFQYMKLEPCVPLRGGATICDSQLKGGVTFDLVTFSYPTRPEHAVLKDFCLHLPVGKVVALCGLSGGGKSTVASLLERFYELEGGSILLDGRNIADLDPSWLRGEVIGFINQEPVLFATTIMENIRYGRPDATDQEVKEAAGLANADTFIESFPLGYQTILGERGVTVSGGQKQRIAIARALLKNPTILVLDEATSALDTESEKLVQEALDRVVSGRTVLIIAHRLSTIQNADIIAVIANGKVAELGNHQSLQRLRGLYWQLTKQEETQQQHPRHSA